MKSRSGIFKRFKGFRVQGFKNRGSRIENGACLPPRSGRQGWRRNAIFYLRSSILALLISLSFDLSSASAQEPFYKGKTIRIVVGLSAGGGYDRAARLISRHLGKYIPGNPDMIVQNMAGAGAVIAATHLYRGGETAGVTPP